MELKEILSKCDHTLLAQTATWEQIRAICDDGMKYGCASKLCQAGRGVCGGKTAHLHGDRLPQRV